MSKLSSKDLKLCLEEAQTNFIIHLVKNKLHNIDNYVTGTCMRNLYKALSIDINKKFKHYAIGIGTLYKHIVKNTFHQVINFMEVEKEVDYGSLKITRTGAKWW